MQPLAEQWSDVALQFTSIYGIRRYFNNSALISHVDRWAETAELVPRATCHVPRTPTHVISAILNIGQDVEEDWPLFLRDHRGEDHVVMRHVSRVTL